MSTTRPEPIPIPEPRDLIVVAASPRHTLDLLRWATLRSDEVRLVAPAVPEAARRFAFRYAVDVRQRPVADDDFAGAAALLLALDDLDDENALIRRARRYGIAIHVHDRPLVSDFSVLAMMERPWPASLAA